MHITMVALLVFDDWYNGTVLELARNKSMEQHHVKQITDTGNQYRRGVKEMFSGYQIIICRFSRLHTEDRIYYCII